MSHKNTDNETAVSFNNVTTVLGGTAVLDNICASVPEGSCTAIVGPNGAGKTTMLMALLSQINYKGTINIAESSTGKKKVIGYVPQRVSIDRGMPITVAEFMTMGFQRSPFWFGVRKNI